MITLFGMTLTGLTIAGQGHLACHDEVREKIVKLALDEPELSSREFPTAFTDQNKYIVSEVSAYRLLKSHDLISAPAYIVVKAADAFRDKTTAPNQM